MEPLVLRRRLRLEKWEIAFLLFLVGLWSWQYSRDSTAAWIILPGWILINGNIFWRRVVLTSDRVTIYGTALYGDSHRFKRIVRYATSNDKNLINVELTLEQKGGKKIELFGSEINFLWHRSQKSAINRTRIITFSIEPEDLDALLNYLRAQGAVADEIAATTWSADYLAKRIRLLKQREDLSEDEAAEILREIEAQLAALNKY